jgi:cytochrome c-type biogenesis protein CcmE
LESWNIRDLEVEPRKPVVLRSDAEARIVAINLPAGEALEDHQVHERAYVVVLDGEVQIGPVGDMQTAPAGSVAHFEPNERHEVQATSDSRLVLFLSPWPARAIPLSRGSPARINRVDPARKRKIRLVVALSAAVLLATALLWVSFSAGTSQLLPSEALAQTPDEPFELGGTVVEGSVKETDDELRFAIKDPNGPAEIPVTYSGSVPDTFREGREVLVDGELKDGVFVGEPNTMTTKCPSKFKAK